MAEVNAMLASMDSPKSSEAGEEYGSDFDD